MTATLTERAQSFGHLFVDRINKTPQGEAFRYRVGDDWKSLTWSQTKDRVFNLAAGLVELGVQPQQRVAIAATTRIEWILADLAILCAGAATTTVYPSTTAPDVAFILGDSESVVIFAENQEQAAKALLAGLPRLTAIVLFDGTMPSTDQVRILTLDELEASGEKLLAEQPDLVDQRIANCGPEDLATLIYTSGTTGRPKGVRLVHDNWMYEGKAVAALGILGPTDVQYLWLPMSHVLGKVLSALQLEFGFSTAVDGDLTRIVENLGVIKPTFMGGAPRIFEKVRAKVTLTAQGDGGIKAKIYDWAIGVGIKASRVRQQRRAAVEDAGHGAQAGRPAGLQHHPRAAGRAHPVLRVRLGAAVPGRGGMVRRRRYDDPRGLRPDRVQRGRIGEPARTTPGSAPWGRRCPGRNSGSPRTARSCCAAAASCAVTTTTRRPPPRCSPRTAGSTPETSASWSTATSRSPTGRRI